MNRPVLPRRSCERLQPRIDQVYALVRERMRTRLPGARLRHLGSTALAPVWCRGQVELQLVSPAAELPDLHRIVRDEEEHLAEMARAHDLSLSLSVADIDLPCPALRHRQVLAQAPLWLGEYRALQAAHHLGEVDDYQRTKAAFFERVEDLDLFQRLDEASILPYQIEIESARLTIKTPLACDAVAFAEYRRRNRAFHSPWSPSRGEEQYQSDEWMRRFAFEALQRWRDECLTFVFFDKDTSRIVGACHFSGVFRGPFQSCFLGYHADQDYQGQGLMAEGVGAAVDYMFETWKLHRIAANHLPRNERSARLLERLGFRVEGLGKNYLQIDGRWQDHVLTARTRDED